MTYELLIKKLENGNFHAIVFEMFEDMKCCASLVETSAPRLGFGLKETCL